MRRWRCPSGRTLVEAPPGRVTGIPGGPLLTDRYYMVCGDLTLDRTYEARSYSLEDDLYETDYAVREGRLVRIESVTHRTDPARETVRFEMNDLVELGPDQPPTERDLLPALGDGFHARLKDAEAWFQDGMKHIELSSHADYQSERTGDLEDAVAAFECAISLSPEHAAAWAQKGYALSRLRRYEAAAAARAEAIRLSPDDAGLRCQRPPNFPPGWPV